MTHERIDALAREAVLLEKSAAPCPNHSDILLDLQFDDDILAERQTQAWHRLVSLAKAEGFDGDPDRELQGALIFALQSVDEVCPKCGTVLPPPDDPALARKSHLFL